MGYLGYKPADKPLTSADITDGIITSAKIVDGTITNSDVASSIITGQTAETSIAGGDSILIYDDSATALRKMTRTNFVSGIGGTNTPAFYAKLTSDQSLTVQVTTKIQIDSEILDTDNCYDPTTNYRFTPNVAGKYYVFASIRNRIGSGSNYTSRVQIYKNGSNYVGVNDEFQTSVSYGQTLFVSGVVDMNGTTDYLELYNYVEWHSGTTIVAENNFNATYFGAYKLIGA
jgi:hypothetical protein